MAISMREYGGKFQILLFYNEFTNPFMRWAHRAQPWNKEMRKRYLKAEEKPVTPKLVVFCLILKHFTELEGRMYCEKHFSNFNAPRGTSGWW